MRIAIVGPTHPFKGGIAQYTTALAHSLMEAGEVVWIESWAHQYPTLLYPGQLTVSTPELPPFPQTLRRLSWKRPDTWYSCGRRLRDLDLVVLVIGNSFQIPQYLGVLAGLGRRRRARIVAQCHNVLPHERQFLDKALVRLVLSHVDGVVVHSPSQGRCAQGLTDRPVVVQRMAPLVVARSTGGWAPRRLHHRLLFFGIVRPYKGLDVLLRALAAGPPGIRLRVAGEFWDGIASTERLVAELGIKHLVELRPGYVDVANVPNLFADVDALVLPYRSATASFNAFLAFEHGVPVIATRVGTLEEDVRDGIDGVLCEPADVEALTAALCRFYAEGEPQRLQSNVSPADDGPAWKEYATALRAAAGFS